MNLEQKISELQERNVKKYIDARMFDYEDKEEAIKDITTDSFNAGALAVIGELKNFYDYYGNVNEVIMVTALLNHLTTLEEALQDNK